MFKKVWSDHHIKIQASSCVNFILTQQYTHLEKISQSFEQRT